MLNKNTWDVYKTMQGQEEPATKALVSNKANKFMTESVTGSCDIS